MRLHNGMSVTGDWDILEVPTPLDTKILEQQVLAVLQRTQGVCLVMRVRTLLFIDLEQAAKEVLISPPTALGGRTFAVRCKRQAEHTFTFIDAERYIGAFLMGESGAGVQGVWGGFPSNNAGSMTVAVYRQ